VCYLLVLIIANLEVINSCGSSLKVFKASARFSFFLFGPSREVKLCSRTKSNNELSMLEFLGGSEVARFSFFCVSRHEDLSSNKIFMQLVLCFLTNFCVVRH